VALKNQTTVSAVGLDPSTAENLRQELKDILGDSIQFIFISLKDVWTYVQRFLASKVMAEISA
jgi:predicted RNA methylase